MSLEPILSEYGAVALFLLATVEGDLSLVIGGVLAHLGILSLPAVILSGAAGNLTGDLGWYAIGHHLRGRIRTTMLYQKVGHRIEGLARKLGPWQLLVARIIYGTRNASMLFWGQYGLPLRQFIPIDALGCLLACTGFALAGYLLGHGTSQITGEVKHLERYLLVAVVVGGLVVWLVTRLVRRGLEHEP